MIWRQNAGHRSDYRFSIHILSQPLPLPPSGLRRPLTLQSGRLEGYLFSDAFKDSLRCVKTKIRSFESPSKVVI